MFPSLRGCGFLALLWVLCAACGSEVPLLEPEVPAGPLRNAGPTQPRPQRDRLLNGMTVLLLPGAEGQLEGTASPVHGILRLAVGQADDASGKAGLAMQTAAALVAECSVSMRVQLGPQWTDFQFSCPQDALVGVLDAIGAVMITPEFPENQAQQGARLQMAEAFEQKDQLVTFARQALGGQVGLGFQSTEPARSFVALQQDLQGFHRSHYGSRRAILALSGVPATAELSKRIAQVFGAWPTQAAAPSFPWAESPAAVGRSLIHVNSEASHASGVVVMFEVPRCDHPDYPALLLAGELLRSATFDLQLHGELRHSSRWELAAAVPADQVLDQLHSFLRSLERGPRQISRASGSHFEQSRDRVLDRLRPDDRSPEQRLASFVALEANGYPRNFNETLIRAVLRLTAREVETAFARHLRMDRLQVFLQGNASLLRADLSEIGSQSIWPRELMGLPRSASFHEPKAVPERWAEVLVAHGGVRSWQQAALLTCQMRSTQSARPAASVHIVWDYPAGFRFDKQAQPDKLVVLQGEKAWMKTGRRSRILTSSEQIAWQSFALALLPAVLMDLARDPDQVVHAELDTLQLLRSDGVELQLSLDSQARVTALRSSGLQIHYSEYQSHDGLLLPGRVEIRQLQGRMNEPPPGSIWWLRSWQVNPIRQPLWFEAPEGL